MSLLSPRPGDFCWETTSTAGTFNTFALSGTRVADPTTGFTYDLFADYFADGELVYYVRSQTVSAGVRAIKEAAIGIYHRGPNTIEPTIGIYSTNMSAGSSTFVPITWGAGSQDVTCGIPGADVVTIRLMAQVLALAAAANRTALGLGTAAIVNTGTTNGNIPVLADDGAGSPGLPAISGRLLTGMPAASIPSGTKLAGFYQSSAPSGWTLLTSIDDMVLGITNQSGTGGGGPHNGGTTGGIGWDASFGISVNGHTLTSGEIPCSLLGAAGSATETIANVGAAAHSHTLSSSSTWRPATAYTILCQRN